MLTRCGSGTWRQRRAGGWRSPTSRRANVPSARLRPATSPMRGIDTSTPLLSPSSITYCRFRLYLASRSVSVCVCPPTVCFATADATPSPNHLPPSHSHTDKMEPASFRHHTRSAKDRERRNLFAWSIHPRDPAPEPVSTTTDDEQDEEPLTTTDDGEVESIVSGKLGVTSHTATQEQKWITHQRKPRHSPSLRTSPHARKSPALNKPAETKTSPSISIQVISPSVTSDVQDKNSLDYTPVTRYLAFRSWCHDLNLVFTWWL